MSRRFLTGLFLAVLVCFGPTAYVLAGGYGACCQTDGTCIDGVAAQSCPAPGEWNSGTTCSQVRCQPTVPTVSHWGLVALGLMLGIGGKIYFNRRKATVRA